MPDSPKDQAKASSLPQIPRWEMVAAARPRTNDDGSVTVRALNHLGHAVDLRFGRDLWSWASKQDCAFDCQIKRQTGSSVTPPPQGNGGGAFAHARVTINGVPMPASLLAPTPRKRGRTRKEARQ